MKKIFKILVALILILGLYGFYIFYSTGFFREIENKFDGEILMKVPIAGVEDMQLSYKDSFMIISSDDRAARRDGNPVQGGLYFIDLKNPLLAPQQITNSSNISTPFFPHGISMIKTDSAEYKIYAINHPDKEVHLIETLLFKDGQFTTDTIFVDEKIFSPNDIVALDGERFYFSNDHGYRDGLGRVAEDYLGLRASNVIYYDGKDFREVASGIAYANGINYDPARALLFLSSPRDFLVKVYKTEANGDLTFIEDIPCGTGVDNIEFDQDGKLWIGCHPSLLQFAAYASGKEKYAPSEIITIDYRGEGDYTVESVFMDDGKNMSAATVAPTFEDYIFLGNVMDEHFLILKK